MLLKDDVLAAVSSKNPLHGYVVAWTLKLVSEIQLLTYSYTINTPLGLDFQGCTCCCLHNTNLCRCNFHQLRDIKCGA